MWATLRRVLLLLVAVVLPAGLAGLAVRAQQGRDRTLSPRTAQCVYRMQGALPDPACTPGAINHAVTQATIKQTICTRGWTATIRPPVTTTEPGKFKSMRQYGDSTAAGEAQKYEFDHLVPLELGGDPGWKLVAGKWVPTYLSRLTQPNLFPELHHVSVGGKDEGSYVKDGVENALNRDVCSGKMTLAAARRAIRKDWTTATP